MIEVKVLHTGPYGVNTLVVPVCEGSKSVFVVDPGSCPACDDENVILDYLTKNSLSPIGVFLTHGHFDHVSGLATFKKQFPDVPVFIHEDDAVLIGKDGEAQQKKYLSFMGVGENSPLAKDYEGMPEPSGFLKAGMLFSELKELQQVTSTGSVTADAELSTRVDEPVEPPRSFERALEGLSDWKILSTPGHTPGSVCFYNEKEKILISGDTLFYHSWGRTDLPGGSEVKMRQSLATLAAMIADDVKVYPGHDYYGFEFAE